MGKGPGQYKFAIAIFAVGFAVGLAGAVVGFYFYGQSPQHFGVEVGKTVLALGTGLILGGALKVMLDQYQAAQQKQAREHELQERLLSDLRNIHDQAETARLMIAAHRSAKAYGEQMQRLIGCQVGLLKIKRSIDLRPTLKDVSEKAQCLAGMIGYLRALQARVHGQLQRGAPIVSATTRRSVNAGLRSSRPPAPGLIPTWMPAMTRGIC